MKKKRKAIVLNAGIICLIAIVAYGIKTRNMNIEKSKAVQLNEKRIHKIDSIRSCKYVYVDYGGVMHLDEECFVLFLSDIDTENNSKKGLKRVVKSDIPDSVFNRCCKSCINDDEYDVLKQLNNCSK